MSSLTLFKTLVANLSPIHESDKLKFPFMHLSLNEWFMAMITDPEISDIDHVQNRRIIMTQRPIYELFYNTVRNHSLLLDVPKELVPQRKSSTGEDLPDEFPQYSGDANYLWRKFEDPCRLFLGDLQMSDARYAMLAATFFSNLIKHHKRVPQEEVDGIEIEHKERAKIVRSTITTLLAQLDMYIE
jgi:hypothetical protein